MGRGASAGAHQRDLIQEELQPCCFKASEGTGRTDRTGEHPKPPQQNRKLHQGAQGIHQKSELGAHGV